MATAPPARPPLFHRPRFEGGRFDGGYRPRFNRFMSPGGHRFRAPGYAGIINDGRQPRPWVEHRPGYTPSGAYNQGKQSRKNAHRKTIDYNATVLKSLQNRMFLRDSEDAPTILPDTLYINEVTTPSELRCNPINCVTTKFVRQSTNKIRCPIFCVAWTPEGRRLVTGASSGEFTLWNGLTFNFETILQAHDSSIRAMIWSHDDNWMMTADHNGFVKYWQSNMNNVKMFQAHKEAIRGLSFSPLDSKFTSCSDDGSVRIFDFATCTEERVLKGHGADVKCVDWHPQKSIIVSGSKDSQQPIKLWDARAGVSLATIHAHKNTVMSMKWNKNGNWFLTASRDHLLKIFDIRNMKSDFQTFKGHQKEATVISWHPIYEDFFASGGSDGAIKFWSVGSDKEVGANDTAHEGFIWSMAWHPLGHILVTGSNDHSTKFWARNKPGDTMKDRYNLNLLPIEDELDDTTSGVDTSSQQELPGMGIDEDLIEQIKQANAKDGIPGLDMDGKDLSTETFLQERKGKYTYTKRIDRSFAAAWEGKTQVIQQQHNQQHDESSSFPKSLLGDSPSDHRDGPPPGRVRGLLDPPPMGGGPNQFGNNNWQGQGPRGPGNDFRGPRPGFNQGPRNDFRGPRPGFNQGSRNDFRGPRPRGQNNFNGPPGNNQNNSGPWNARPGDQNNQRGNWNRSGPNQGHGNQNNNFNNRSAPY